MSKPKLYHHYLRARITREQRQAIQEYAKRHGLRWGEAVRELIEQALEQGKGDGADQAEPGDLLLARLVKREDQG